MKYSIHLKILLIITFISLLIISPTLVNQHWALLDDALILRMAKILEKTWLIPVENNGRYRPLYWLYYIIQYKFFGTGVNGYYLVQAIVLIITNILIYVIVNLLTKSNILSWISVVTFLTSSSLVENYYTLTKQEPRLVLLFLLSIYCYLRAEPLLNQFCSISTRNFVERINLFTWLMASAVSLLCAYLTKETSVIILLASIVWVAITFYLEKGAAPRIKTKIAIGYLGLNSLSFIVSIIAAYGYKRTKLPWAGNYTKSLFSLTLSVDDALSYARVNFDVFILTIFLIISITILVCIKPSIYDKTAAYTLFFTLCSLVYLSFFTLFWINQFVYYSLPVAAWNAIAISLIVKLLITTFQPSQVRIALKLLIVSLFLLTRAYSIPTFYNVAVAQKAWDKVNAQMLEEIAKLPKQSQILLNYDKDFQYLIDTHLLLKFLYNRSDLNLGSMFNPEDLWQNPQNQILLVNFGSETNENVPVRAMSAPLLKSFEDWALSINGLELKKLFLTQSNKSIVLPFTLQSVPFSLGWIGYQVVKLPEVFLEKDGDGWIGKEADLWVTHDRGTRKILITGASFLPPNLAYPIHLDVWQSSSKIESFTINKADKFQLSLNLPFPLPENSKQQENQYIKLKLVTDKTFVPAQQGLNSDTRELSVIIDNIKFSK